MTVSAQVSKVIETPEGYRISYVTITPQFATQLLAANTNNRRVKVGNLGKIGDDMLNGRWVFNGDAIRVDRDGSIIDGQHRLMEVERTGVSIQALLVTGLPLSARATIDTGSVRAASDELRMSGYKNDTTLASITSAYVRLMKHGLLAAIDGRGVPGNVSASVSTSEIIDTIESNEWLPELASHASLHSYKNLNKTIGSTLYWVFKNREATPGDADYFFERLKDGVGLDADSPILRLRAALDALYVDKGRPQPKVIGAITIKAWNKFQLGEPCKALRFRIGGANPERFPEPI